MRKLKKINGYLIVKFNDRELREWDGTGLGAYGVIDAELYTGCLGVDRSVMEYDSAETIEQAEEQARGLESEFEVTESDAEPVQSGSGKWCVTSQYIGDEKMYAVYRLRDVNAVDHSGNREYATDYTKDAEAVKIIAAALNSGELQPEAARENLDKIIADEPSRDETPQHAADQSSATAFHHLPETVNPGNNEKVFWLGLQLEQDCPENDCRLYRNLFRMCREIDDQVNRLTGWPRTRMDAELRKQYFDLETTYLTNHAVRQYRQQLRTVHAQQDESGYNLSADEVRKMILGALDKPPAGSITIDESVDYHGVLAETEKTPDGQVPCSECASMKAPVPEYITVDDGTGLKIVPHDAFVFNPETNRFERPIPPYTLGRDYTEPDESSSDTGLPEPDSSGEGKEHPIWKFRSHSNQSMSSS